MIILNLKWHLRLPCVVCMNYNDYIFFHYVLLYKSEFEQNKLIFTQQICYLLFQGVYLQQWGEVVWQKEGNIVFFRFTVLLYYKCKTFWNTRMDSSETTFAWLILYSLLIYIFLFILGSLYRFIFEITYEWYMCCCLK